VVQLFKLAQETDPQLAVFVRLAASTGARRGELIALRGDINLERGVVNIERGVVLAKKVLIEQGTKTHQARRVTIDAETGSTLRSHLQRQNEQARSIGTSMHRDAFVFTHAVDLDSPV